MAKQQQNKTNVQNVKKQNQQSAQGYGTEFASETNAQQVRQQNQKAEQNKQQNS